MNKEARASHIKVWSGKDEQDGLSLEVLQQQGVMERLLDIAYRLPDEEMDMADALGMVAQSVRRGACGDDYHSLLLAFSAFSVALGYVPERLDGRTVMDRYMLYGPKVDGAVLPWAVGRMVNGIGLYISGTETGDDRAVHNAEKCLTRQLSVFLLWTASSAVSLVPSLEHDCTDLMRRWGL